MDHHPAYHISILVGKVWREREREFCMIKYAVEMKVKTSIQLWKESKKEQKYKDCHLYVKRWRERMQEEKIKKIRSMLNQYFNFVQGGVLVQC